MCGHLLGDGWETGPLKCTQDEQQGRGHMPSSFSLTVWWHEDNGAATVPGRAGGGGS